MDKFQYETIDFNFDDSSSKNHTLIKIHLFWLLILKEEGVYHLLQCRLVDFMCDSRAIVDDQPINFP